MNSDIDMSSPTAVEPPSPSVTTPSSPALRSPSESYPNFQTSTPNLYAKRSTTPLTVILPPAVPSTSFPTYGDPALTPPPRSPGTANNSTAASGDGRTQHQPDGTSSDKSSETAVAGVSRTPSTALTRKESYKAQRQHYRREKKRVASALLHSIEDPSVVVLADWLKVRGSLKSWTKLWCVLKPGLLLLYKTPKVKSSHWVGTVLLTSCQVIERPSKKDGFCFKLYHPLEQSIWAPRGPHNETIGAVVQPLPTAHLIFRAPSQSAGHCWLDGLELALRCSNAMLRCSRARAEYTVTNEDATNTNLSHEELEKHFTEHVPKPAAAVSLRSPTPLMSVSDYYPSPSRRTPTRPPAKMPPFPMLDHPGMGRDVSSESQSPDNEDKRKSTHDKGLLEFSFLKKSSCFPVTPTKREIAIAPRRSPLLPSLQLKKLPIASLESYKRVKLSPSALLEDNLIKFMTMLPKRRSSTPSSLNVVSRRISDLRASGAKTDSENDDAYRNKESHKRRGASPVAYDTRDNIIITKTPPSVDDIFNYSSSSSTDGRGCRQLDCRSLTPRVCDGGKFSLIDYKKMPSQSYEALKLERRDERLSSQKLYVAGKVLTNELAGAASDSESEGLVTTMAEGEKTGEELMRLKADILATIERVYTVDLNTDTGSSGELIEEVAEENKSLLWFLMKQVRPGMDLSKVVLPTFILEPRSFLDKLSDSYYHADILSVAAQLEDPYSRFKAVLRWYLSGLYRKPKGLKKPYNPVLGEVFRCCWRHPVSGTNTYYVAEQVSHHPPVSAFYVSNRKDGFIIEGSLLARSKFYGNSTSAILEGCARVVLLKWGETYLTTAPYAHCKGIVIGTLSMELGGKVHVICTETGYHADIEFKLRSFLSGSDQTNAISGRIKKGKDTVATVEGYWDGKIDIKDKKSGEDSNLLDVATLRLTRLQRYLMKVEHQQEFESQRLWLNVSEAIMAENQVVATEHKTVIEEGQRNRAKQLSGPWVPRLFHKDSNLLSHESIVDQGWRYNNTNLNPWQPSYEILEYEEDFLIRSLSSAPSTGLAMLGSTEPRRPIHRGSDSDSHCDLGRRNKTSSRTLKQTLHAIDIALREQTGAIERLSRTVDVINENQNRSTKPQNLARLPTTSHSWDLFAGFVLAIVLQSLLNWIFYRKDN